MRILIISFVFPPHNIIGAVRVGKTAKYLSRLGHDVRVITAGNLDIPATLELEIPSENVTYTAWKDVDAPFRAALRLRNRLKEWFGQLPRDRVAAPRPEPTTSEGPQSSRRTVGWRARLWYITLFHLPDAAIGWRPFAVRAGRMLLRQWRADVILASGAPWTSFVVARDVARDTGIPWVADLRDLWSDNHTTFVSGWRMRIIDSRYERRVLRTASALVTVSEPLAARLRRRYPDKSVDVIMNGFDADDYASRTASATTVDATPLNAASVQPPASQEILRLVYTGEINRNMVPLLDALQLLGGDAQFVSVEIVGHLNDEVRDHYRALAAARGLVDRFIWLPSVPHSEAARLQQRADVLLLFMHATTNDLGVFTGKLLEYVGAGRPILVVGDTEGVAASLVRDRGLGAAERTAPEVADRIREWIREKHALGVVRAPCPRGPIDDLSRETQTRAYARVLDRVTKLA
jgi:glycosyltransferase involved in cell wall biosynthesis